MSKHRVLFVDASAGASGDMILGALVDLGVSSTRLRQSLRALPVDGWTLRARRVVRCGLAGRKVDVRVRGEQPARGLRALRRALRGGSLDAAVKRRAEQIFLRLLEAEAEVHGSSVDRVHLHEAGGTDAIVDVVGAALGLTELGPSRIVVSTMTTGFGTVRCEHGQLPVPGPATLALVRNCPVRAGEIEAERLTPTGAAILTAVADAWGPLPPMRPLAVGCGFGDRDLGDTPNMLRMVLGEPLDESTHDDPQIVVLECNVDDRPAQNLAYADQRLREAGALDVFTAAVAMKKNRSGLQLTVLAREEHFGELSRIVLEETGTLGLRYHRARRIELQRSVRKVETRWGSIDVKLGFLGDRRLSAWPEYERCAELARRHHVPLEQIQQAALRALEPDNKTKASGRKRRR